MWTQLSLFDSPLAVKDSTARTDAAPCSDAGTDGRTVAEFLAGIGLVRLGLEQAGWRVIWANDIDVRKYAMYKSAFPDAAAHYVVEDVFELDPARIPATTLVTASFPCIDLSLAGKQKGLAGKHSSAFWGFWEILRTQIVRPPIVLLENVPGFLTSNKGRDFRTAIQALNELGYWCDVIALDALHFTPQSRLRLFVIAIQPDLTLFMIPSGKSLKSPSALPQRSSSLMPKSLKEAFSHNRDLGWHFLPCPPPPPKRKEGLTSIVEEMADDDPRWWHEDAVVRHLSMIGAVREPPLPNLLSTHATRTTTGGDS